MEISVDEKERIADANEIRSAIEALTEDEFLRIERAGRLCVPGSDYKTSHEVMNEAICRAIDGCGKKTGRHWPIERVDFVAFMIMTMKSLASDSRESELMTKTDFFDKGKDGEDELGSWALDRLGHQTPGVERQLIDAEDVAEDEARIAERQAAAKADADKIDDYFKDDQDVAWLVMCLKEEKAPSKARAAAGLTQTQYETTRKRMRRGVERLFPGRSPR